MNRFHKIVSLLILFSLFLGILSVSSVHAQSTGVDVNYTLDISDPYRGEAIVRMEINHLSGEVLSIQEYGYHGIGINVQYLKATDVNGAVLPFEHLPDSGIEWRGKKADIWKIDLEGNLDIVVEYGIKPGGFADAFEGAMLSQSGTIQTDFAAFSGEYAFLYPPDKAINNIDVTFKAPHGWGIYTPWEKKNGSYSPGIDGLDPLESLMLSVFTLGAFDTYTKDINGTSVEFVAYSPWEKDFKEQLADQAWRIYTYQSNMFSDLPGTRYLIFCWPKTGYIPISGGEWSTSQGYSYNKGLGTVDLEFWYIVSHALFHSWNSWAWGTDWVNQNWWREGINTFYESKLTSKLSIADEELGIRQFDRFLSSYTAKYGTSSDYAVGKEQWDVYTVYNKGALVTLLLARDIYLATDGEKTLDDLMAVLFDKYGLYQVQCNQNCVRREIELLTGTDFSTFFRDYVNGTKILPVEWYYADDDQDGLINTYEVFWDMHPEKEDSDGDGENDYQEFLNALARINPEDEAVEVTGTMTVPSPELQSTSTLTAISTQTPSTPDSASSTVQPEEVMVEDKPGNFFTTLWNWLVALFASNEEHLSEMTLTPAEITPELTETPEIPTTTPKLPTSTVTLTNTPTTTPTPTTDPNKKISAKDGMTQLLVPAGEFIMGADMDCTDVWGCTDPERSIYLDSYWIDQTTVTNRMYALFVADTGYRTQAELGGMSSGYIPIETNLLTDYTGIAGGNWQEHLGPGTHHLGENYPVVHMTWQDANAYCEWAERRLPTEAEWEKAARGTEGQKYTWGNSEDFTNKGNFWVFYAEQKMYEGGYLRMEEGAASDSFDLLSPVDQFPEGASPFGAMDMAGNVYEWVSDWFIGFQPYDSDLVNPQGPE
ncbi:MAG: SUMF1/EgtB/PvdO family nonheme iron enzyme, partial [Anaerolineaceae bacterium]|nr:SUMF1/EgtB/PvdO family nonheme iron enzyme [Anaerolineaceae bacterium]